MIRLTRLGSTQISAHEIEILDPIHAENGDEFPGSLEGSTLTIADRERAYRLLIDAANGCDEEGDVEFRDALARMASRVLRATDVSA